MNGSKGMEGHSLYLYPVRFEPIEGIPSNVRVFIETPYDLPWWQLWLSVGAVLSAMSGGYNAAKRLFGSSIAQSSSIESLLDDDLRIVRLKYGSPVDIELLVHFISAFSLIWGIATGAITTTIKLLEWIETKRELKDKCKRRLLEDEKLQLEIEEMRKRVLQPASTLQLPGPVPEPQDPLVITVIQMFFFGEILARRGGEIWIPYLASEPSERESQLCLWGGERGEVEFGAFMRGNDGRIWFFPQAPCIIGDVLKS